MLMGWLERHASERGPRDADLRATAVITVAEVAVPEVEAFCARWDMTIARSHRGDDDRAVLEVQGPMLPVQGFTEITAMYRR